MRLPRVNPFRPGSPHVDARLFVGRERELRRGYKLLLQTLDRNPRYILIRGPRGIGKSWLGQAIERIARGEKPFVELLGDDFDPFASPLLTGYVEGRRNQSLQQLVENLVGSLRRQVGSAVGGLAVDVEFSIGFVKFRPKPNAPVDDLLMATILEIKDIWAEASGKRSGILLVIDELDEAVANDDLGSFLKVLIGQLGRENMD